MAKRGPRPSGRRKRLAALAFTDPEWSFIRLAAAREGTRIAAWIRARLVEASGYATSTEAKE